MSDPLERHPQLSVVRRLAVGGMGEVLLTRFAGNAHLRPGLVVVKRTIPEHPHRAHQDEMLREEGRVALRLRHANLVDTYALDELEGHPLLVMEYLAGRSMAQVLGAAKRKQQPVPVPVALAVLHGAACGLHFAHTLREGDTPLGLVHRDVSPANIFATFDGKVKVIDFGVAKADDSEIKTSTGILKGKLGYMSPEHAKGEKLDPRSDLWSLGVVFWEMLVADRLFGGQNPAMTLFQITQGQLEAPSQRRPDLPPVVEQLCMRLLTKDREQRIASGAELVREIERLPPELWRGADVGGFLAERFPAEAETGQREVREAATWAHPRPVPTGLVDGGSGAEEPAEMATVVVDGQALVAAALAAGAPREALPTQPSLPPVAARPVPSVTSDPFAPSASARQPPAYAGASAPAVPSQQTPLQHLGGPTAVQRPVAGGRLPTPPSSAAIPTLVEVPRESGRVPTPPPQGAPVPLPSASGRVPTPAPAPSAPAAAISLPPSTPFPAVPVTPAPTPAPTAAQIPAPTPAQVPAQVPAPTRTPTPLPAVADAVAARPSRPPTESGSRRLRAKGPSAVAVALSTFGALAVVMGLAFALLAEQRQSRPIFVGYLGPDGTDVVVARVEDVPPSVGQPFQVTLDGARLAVEPGKARDAIAAAPLARELKKAGVWRRAVLPKTAKQRVAAALPCGIMLLGLLSLAFALPGLLMQAGTRQLTIRTLGVLASLALGAFLLREGGLGWPGLGALQEPPEVPRLAFTGAPPALRDADLPPEAKRQLTDALVAARAAILRGQPHGAVAALAPVIELKPDLPAIYSALGDAHRDLEKPSLAEGHYLRYLELLPDAPDRADVEAYLRQVQEGAVR